LDVQLKIKGRRRRGAGCRSDQQHLQDDQDDQRSQIDAPTGDEAAERAQDGRMIASNTRGQRP